MKKTSKTIASDFLKKKQSKKQKESVYLHVAIVITSVAFILMYFSLLLVQNKQIEQSMDELGILKDVLNNEMETNKNLQKDVNSLLEGIELKTITNESDLKYEYLIKEFGDMGDAMVIASKEYDVPLGLLIGIANAESTLGKNFYNPYDVVCKNWWGIKGGNTQERIENENSYIRCFNDELAGARTVAKTLRLYYLNEGRDTPEKIADKWVGKNQTEWHETWVNNVNKYFK